MERLDEALYGAVGVAAVQGGAVVCVNLMASLGAECNEEDHGTTGLLRAEAKRGQVVDICGSVEAESGGQTVDDGVIPNAP